MVRLAVLTVCVWAKAGISAFRPAPRGWRVETVARGGVASASAEEAGHLLGFGDADHVMSTLQRINARRAEVAEGRDGAYEELLLKKIEAVDAAVGPPMDVAARLRADAAGGSVAIAAEFKRASPSKGPINVDADIGDVASSYAAAGASLVSVLTEPEWFEGSLDDLYAARAAVTDLLGRDRRPALLRKDFVSRPVQVLEARAFGADCVLLIVACLSKTELTDLVAACGRAGVMALVEVHTEAEMALALDCPGVECIGINNRNLHSFQLDMSTTPRLMAFARARKPDAFAPGGGGGLVFASLSGVSLRSEVEALRDVECVLVGEALMRAADPELLVKQLKGTEATDEDSALEEKTRPLAKVCGVASVDDALAACRAGADLIGVIHVEKSKRFVDTALAKDIVDAVRDYGERSARWEPTARTSLEQWAEQIRRDTSRGRPLVVGVVQDQPLPDVLDFLKVSGVDVLQLHGSESADYASELPVPHVRVLHAPAVDPAATDDDVVAHAKALASDYEANFATPKCCAVVLDAVPAGQALSGGAGEAFDWRLLAALSTHSQLRAIVAGGLDGAAVAAAAGDCAGHVGYDASSKLERAPGAKDHGRVRDYVAAVKATANRAAWQDVGGM